MTQPAANPQVAAPGTLWKRAIGMFVVCMVAVGVLAFALIVGLIPVSFGIGGNPIQLTIGKLEGTKMTAYVGSDPSVQQGGKAGAIAALEGGEMHEMCLSTVLDLPVVGELSIMIRSGESKPIPFGRMTAFADSMGIDAVTIKDVSMGLDGSDLSANNLVRGPDGSWAMEMDHVTVTNIVATGEEADVGLLRLRGLGLELQTGRHGCPTRAAAK